MKILRFSLIFAGIVSVLLAFFLRSTALAQGVEITDIDIIPPNPTQQDDISVQISGTWPDSCVPTDPQASSVENNIQIDTSNPSEICLPALTDWNLTVPIGQLPVGIYHVTVSYSSLGGQPVIIGTRDFTVGTTSLSLDHFKCYRVWGQSPQPPPVTLQDQFKTEEDVQVLRPYLLCAPVNKNQEGFANLDGENGPHLVCYKTRRSQERPRFSRETVDVRNQFGIQELIVLNSANLLCVPSQKSKEGFCTENAECISGEYCAKEAGDCAGVGTCSPRPEFCSTEFVPVCGCDGQTHGNACVAAQQGVNVAHAGQCTP